LPNFNLRWRSLPDFCFLFPDGLEGRLPPLDYLVAEFYAEEGSEAFDLPAVGEGRSL
jgi:hypothetical protein